MLRGQKTGAGMAVIEGGAFLRVGGVADACQSTEGGPAVGSSSQGGSRRQHHADGHGQPWGGWQGALIQSLLTCMVGSPWPVSNHQPDFAGRAF